MNLAENNPNTGKSTPWVPGPAWRAAEAAGIDMSLIDLSLAKTPWERLLEHDRALAQANLLRRAVQKRNGTTEHHT